MKFYDYFMRSQKPEAPTHQAHNVSAIQGPRGGRQGHGGCGGGGGGGPNAHALGLVPQEEIDKVTTVKNNFYPTSMYNKFTMAKKAKNWQLRNPGKTPGTGRSGRKTNKSSATVAELTSAITAFSAASLAISYLTAATTKQTAAEKGGTNNDDSNVDNQIPFGRNHNNPTLAGCQGSMPKKQKN